TAARARGDRRRRPLGRRPPGQSLDGGGVVVRSAVRGPAARAQPLERDDGGRADGRRLRRQRGTPSPPPPRGRLPPRPPPDGPRAGGAPPRWRAERARARGRGGRRPSPGGGQ